ncbi:hypothetical protein [Mesorhizobium neociceri]|uniref:Uncharacterized protein n=1 Tax=Mesorhizobium neociceri TaxID=1307853 RepID=A0A838BES1_9HYPH|nr:hypothetical protein [Mesorhizobium neociceri]MBA1144723.1 hypothetical protein [Mesorhizobium neociceri]
MGGRENHHSHVSFRPKWLAKKHEYNCQYADQETGSERISYDLTRLHAFSVNDSSATPSQRAGEHFNPTIKGLIKPAVISQ